MAPIKYDVAVVGGGPVGLGAALALSRRLPGARIALIAGPPRAPAPSRAFALSPGSRRFLDDIGAWRAVEPDAQPIVAMTIFDGEPDEPIRRRELTFDAREGEALAHMATQDSVTAALEAELAETDVARIAGEAAAFAGAGAIGKLALRDGALVEARLIVAADGGESVLREAAGIKSVRWDYGQTGIVATLAHERPHDGVAEQVFFPAGPFAALPLNGNRSSIVWSEETGFAKALLAGPRDAFVNELAKRFPAKLGAFNLEGAPQGFPLGFCLARTFVARRLALVGEAAHRVHPLAGQGLNLGLRDVAGLVDAVAQGLSLGLDPGDAQGLAAYERARRFDVTASGLGMDAMNRLFSNRVALAQVLRDFGLRLVDRAGPLKRALVREAAGL